MSFRAAAVAALRSMPDEKLAEVVRACPDRALLALVHVAWDLEDDVAPAEPLTPTVATPAPSAEETAHRVVVDAIAESGAPLERAATDADETPEEERRGTRPTGPGSRTTLLEPVLKALHALGGRATLKQLEQRTGLSQTVVARASRLLEEQGTIRRARPTTGTSRGAPMTCELLR